MENWVLCDSCTFAATCTARFKGSYGSFGCGDFEPEPESDDDADIPVEHCRNCGRVLTNLNEKYCIQCTHELYDQNQNDYYL